MMNELITCIILFLFCYFIAPKYLIKNTLINSLCTWSLFLVRKILYIILSANTFRYGTIEASTCELLRFAYHSVRKSRGLYESLDFYINNIFCGDGLCDHVLQLVNIHYSLSFRRRVLQKDACASLHSTWRLHNWRKYSHEKNLKWHYCLSFTLKLPIA